MLTSTMYEGDGSFTSGASSNNNQEEQVDVSTFRHEVEDDAAVMDLVAPPPYPPPTAGSGSFPPPPVSIVETSTADWGMMVVDRTSNGQDYANTNNHVEDDDDDEEDDYELVQGGALILDGVSSTNGEDHEEDPDASLSVPDSDNIPSDPGTIHGAPGGGGESANHSRATGNWEHLISDDEEGEDEDDEERHGNATRGRRYRGRMTLKAIFSRFYHFVICAGQSIIAPFEGAATTEDASSTASTMEATSFPQFVRTNGFSLLLVTMAVFFIPGYSYYQMAKSARNYEARWMQLQEENARLQQQEEHLRKEMEMLEEEAIAAMAKATSLYQELEKSKVLHAASAIRIPLLTTAIRIPSLSLTIVGSRSRPMSVWAIVGMIRKTFSRTFGALFGIFTSIGERKVSVDMTLSMLKTTSHTRRRYALLLTVTTLVGKRKKSEWRITSVAKKILSQLHFQPCSLTYNLYLKGCRN
jgi:cell division protein FtsB